MIKVLLQERHFENIFDRGSHLFGHDGPVNVLANLETTFQHRHLQFAENLETQLQSSSKESFLTSDYFELKTS